MIVSTWSDNQALQSTTTADQQQQQQPSRKVATVYPFKAEPDDHVEENSPSSAAAQAWCIDIDKYWLFLAAEALLRKAQ